MAEFSFKKMSGFFRGVKNSCTQISAFISSMRLVPSTPPPILHQNSTDVPFVALDALQAAGDQGAFRGRKFHSSE